ARALAGPEYRTDVSSLRRREELAMQRAYDPKALRRQETISYVAHVASAAHRFNNLENIAVPTVVLHGADDPLVPVESAHTIANRIPEADLRIVEGWGHDLPQALVPHVVNAIVSAASKTP